VIGGQNSTSYRNDTWYSNDGAIWTQATGSAGFSPRYGHAVLVFNNRLWVIGGFDGKYKNDVWSSEDGVNWQQVTASAGFSPRHLFSAVVYDNKMWVIGGENAQRPYTDTSDVWYSGDGVTWTRATGAAGFSPRGGLISLVYNNRLWVLSGFSGTGTTAASRYNDVWSSSDGTAWQQENSSAAFTGRYDLSSVVFDNKIWVIGGNDGSYKNDVWYFSEIRNPTLGLIFTKTVFPQSIKQGYNATVTVTLQNQGKSAINDIEILDATVPELPAYQESLYYKIQNLEPNETYIGSYIIHPTLTGTFNLGKASVMYADDNGNYHKEQSNAPTIDVIAPLIPVTSQQPSAFIDTWLLTVALGAIVACLIIIIFYLINKKS
jgi:hypothetical protein